MLCVQVWTMFVRHVQTNEILFNLSLLFFFSLSSLLSLTLFSHSLSLSLPSYDPRSLENELFLLLDVAPSDTEKVHFIKILTHEMNPWIVVHCVRLARCSDDNTRLKRRTLMAQSSDNSRHVLRLLESSEKGEDASNWAQARERRAMVGGGETAESSMELDGADGGAATTTSSAGAAPTWETKLRTVDLESLAFTEGVRFMSSKRIQLLDGTWRAQKKGYEE